MSDYPRVKRYLVYLLICISLFVWTGKSCATDWSDIFKKIKIKYAEFERELKDMAIEEERKIIVQGKGRFTRIKLFKKGNKFRRENWIKEPDISKKMDKINNIEIYDGKEAWRISSFKGIEKLPDINAAQYKTEKNWWELISAQAEITGEEKVAGRECFVVEFELKEGSPFTSLWIDKKDLVLIKAERKLPGETTLWIYSDYRKTKDDWEIPFTTRVYLNSKLIFTSNIESIEVDEGLSDGLFNPDKVDIEKLNLQGRLKKRMQKGNW